MNICTRCDECKEHYQIDHMEVNDDQTWVCLPCRERKEGSRWTNQKLIELEINQVQTSDSVFEFPVEVNVNFKDGSNVVEKVNVTRRRQQFKITSDEEPASLDIDPNTVLVADWVLNQI